MSDVPLGVFLSGGIDSSIIAAVAREHFDRLNSFSVGMEGCTDLITDVPPHFRQRFWKMNVNCLFSVPFRPFRVVSYD